MKKSNQQNKWTLLNFDSAEEMYFDAWLKELGVTYQYKPEPFVLCDPVKLRIQKQRSIGEVHLLHGLQYQPDFVLESFPAHIGTILFSMNICVSTIKEPLKNALFLASVNRIFLDTKGSDFMGSKRSSDIRFAPNQKMVYQKFGIYVNSVIPEKLFDRTFAPECFFFTETGKERTKKINGEFVGFGKLYKRIGDI